MGRVDTKRDGPASPSLELFSFSGGSCRGPQSIQMTPLDRMAEGLESIVEVNGGSVDGNLAAANLVRLFFILGRCV